MSITVQSLSASPGSISSGQTSTITPGLSNPGKTATITVEADGSKQTVQVLITAEAETFSVNPADIGKTGFVVATVDQGGTLSVGTGGTFVFTAS